MPHSRNKFVPILTTLALMLGNPYEIVMCPINVKSGKGSIYCHNVEVKLDRKLWLHSIKKFLKEGSYPSSTDSTNRKTRLACCFFPSGEMFIEDHMMISC